MMARFTQAIGRGVLGNKTASGTAIIEELGPEHLRTGSVIVYTSADSVFQIAAHEEVVPLDELYRISEIARKLCDEIPVARVIARPFVGEPGRFKRTYNRRDFSMPPPSATVLDDIAAAKLPVVGVGKIWDIFAGRGVTENLHSEGNADGMECTLEALGRVERGLVFTNLVDFDMLYGHRRDPDGYYRALQEFDAFLPRLVERLGPRDAVLITADHGNDPTWRGTDHTREYVPLLAVSRRAMGHDLGVRRGFYDIAQTLADGFGLTPRPRGASFLPAIQ
jgi:phosphopentomutase